MAKTPTTEPSILDQPDNQLDELIRRASGTYKGLNRILGDAIYSAGAKAHNTDLDAAGVLCESMGALISEMVAVLDRRDGIAA